MILSTLIAPFNLHSRVDLATTTHALNAITATSAALLATTSLILLLIGSLQTTQVGGGAKCLSRWHQENQGRCRHIDCCSPDEHDHEYAALAKSSTRHGTARASGHGDAPCHTSPSGGDSADVCCSRSVAGDDLRRVGAYPNFSYARSKKSRTPYFTSRSHRAHCGGIGAVDYSHHVGPLTHFLFVTRKDNFFMDFFRRIEEKLTNTAQTQTVPERTCLRCNPIN